MNDETKQMISETVEVTIEAAEEAVRQPMFKRLARFGFYAKGLLFIVIGALAVLVSLGSSEGRISDAVGALEIISEHSFGKVLLVLFVIGAIGHGVWNILRGTADVDNAGTNWQGITRRVISVGIGFFYLGLALTAAEIIISAPSPGTDGHAEEMFISVLLAIPLFGAVLLFLIGTGVMIAGIHECYSGLTGKYQESYRLWEINGPHMTMITVLGILSFTARAVLLVIMGYYFAAAAFNGLDGSIGMDASLLVLLQSTYGRVILFVTAVGLVSHGVLALYEARFRRLC